MTEAGEGETAVALPLGDGALPPAVYPRAAESRGKFNVGAFPADTSCRLLVMYLLVARTFSLALSLAPSRVIAPPRSLFSAAAVLTLS